MAELFDVAIVGGGVAGTYCAWRLKEARAPARVGLFEGSGSIGGRLLSLTPPGMPHLRAEMGGITYFSSQKLVRSLVENKLQIANTVVPASDSSLAPSPDNRIYLRGKHLRFADLSDPADIPYQLCASAGSQKPTPVWIKTWIQKGSFPSPMEVLRDTLEEMLPGLRGLTGEELRDFLVHASYGGRPLRNWGFWNLLGRGSDLTGFNHEWFQFTCDTLGVDFMLMNYNAVDVIAKFYDVGKDPTMKRLVKGYQELPLTLADLFQKSGGELRLNYRLKSIDKVSLDDEEVMQLSFRALGTGETGWAPLVFGEPVTVYARKLILAMPRRSLELLDQTGSFFAGGEESNILRERLKSVTPVPMFRAYLCYTAPWWKDQFQCVGKGLTDLAIRQCFYWGVEGEQPGADPSNRNALLMAAFNDSSKESYWAGLLRLQEGSLIARSSRSNTKENSDSPAWMYHRSDIGGPLVSDLQRQLCELHRAPALPDPYDAVSMDWGSDPFGGASHLWNSHVQSSGRSSEQRGLSSLIAHPLEKFPVFICGEAYSLKQGFVEGALESAEDVLEQYFDVAPPDWITEDPVMTSDVIAAQTTSNSRATYKGN